MIGEVIGSYRLVRALGQGGMGAVYLGEHTLLGRRAAIKVLLPTLSSRPEMVARFFNEARAATAIADPGIVQVYDFGYHQGAAFIVMELLEGEALDRRLERLGRLAPADALRIARQLASTLASAHACGIVHRDLKPENVFLVHDPEVAGGERVKVLDFGIAKLSGEAGAMTRTQTGAIMGTPLYMSPEQCRGAGEVDHRSDIYALGCVLHHLLVGRPPFVADGMGEVLAMHLYETAPPPSVVLPFLGGACDALVMRCLAKTPDERHADMNEVATEIERRYVAVAASATAGSEPSGDSQRWRAATVMQRTPTTLGGATGVRATDPTTVSTRGRRWLVAGGVAMAAAAATVLGFVLARPLADREAATDDESAVTEVNAATAATAPTAATAVAAPTAPTATDVAADVAAGSTVDAGAVADAATDAAMPTSATTSRRHHPPRVNPAAEERRTMPSAPPPPVDDPCRMDELGNVIDRHRCKE